MCTNPRNKSQGCMQWLPETDFKKITSTRRTNLCLQCIEINNTNATTDSKISQSVRKANERSVKRGGIERLKTCDAIKEWDNKCNLCNLIISIHCAPNQPIRAVIDRIDTTIRSYHQNFQWLCNRCNNRKHQTSFHSLFSPVCEIAISAGHGRSMQHRGVLFSHG